LQRLQLRTLLSCSNLTEVKLEIFSEVLKETQSHCTPAGSETNRDKLNEILPPSQEMLPKRKMSDSLLHAVIPIGSNPEVQLKYVSSVGGARLGRLLQDMDYFAAVVIYKHILNPLQTDSKGLSAHLVVTGRMDHVHLKESIKEDLDVVLVGHVTYVGKSSAEVGVRLDQLEKDGSRRNVLEARFVMVSKDAATGLRSAPLNPLLLETLEEQYIFSKGKENLNRRAKEVEDSLFFQPPSQEENELIHKMFLSTIDHKERSFSARIKPDNSNWMGTSKLKSVMLCEPEHKNDYNVVFGGLIMEKCVDLACINTYHYCKSANVPVCTHIDDVVFKRSVNIGDLLFFHSQVVFTHENKIQTRVSAEIMDKDTQKLKLSNVLQMTFELPQVVPSVIPMSYHEAMAYLTGRRHFLLGLEKSGILEEGMANKLALEGKSYQPTWFDRSSTCSIGDEKCYKSVAQQILQKEAFVKSTELSAEIQAAASEEGRS